MWAAQEYDSNDGTLQKAAQMDLDIFRCHETFPVADAADFMFQTRWRFPLNGLAG